MIKLDLERRDGKRILALYLLRRQQKVEPRFGMADSVRGVALREYRRQMERALGAELVKACTPISCWRRCASSRLAGR